MSSTLSVALGDPETNLGLFGRLLSYVDGNWVDICSIITAVAYVTWQWAKRPKESRGAFICRDVGIEFVNAASLFPLLLLTLSFVSSKFTEALLSGNKITLSIAGGFALFALLEDRNGQPKQVFEAELVGPPRISAKSSPVAAPKVAAQAVDPMKQNPHRSARKRAKR